MYGETISFQRMLTERGEGGGWRLIGSKWCGSKIDLTDGSDDPVC